jgi:hypothetical protein
VTHRLLRLNSKWSLVSGLAVRVLIWVVSTRRDIEKINAVLGEDWCESRGVGGGPRLGDVVLLFEPVGAGNAEEERHIFWDDAADEVDDFDCQTGAVLPAAAVFVCALVADWRDELVEEVAVSWYLLV